ncbi:MAG TPA: branched-chain amino acid ABC transporter permease [Alphaproteobacteria bacterium]|nr:branched-chain amino acid ABC transporter permease [Alphaproteobacteria bacterium]
MSAQVAPERLIAPRKAATPLQQAILTGLVFGIIGLYLAIVGILAMFNNRWIVVDVLTLGQAALLAIGLGVGAFVASRSKDRAYFSVAWRGLVAGAIAGAIIAVLVVAMDLVNLRVIFIALSPELFEILTFHSGLGAGIAILVAGGAVLGMFGGLLALSAPIVRRPVLIGFATVIVVGVFEELIQIMMQWGDLIGAVRDFLFDYDGLLLQGAAVIFLVTVGVVVGSAALKRRGVEFAAIVPPAQRQHLGLMKALFAVLILVLFPIVAGSYIGQVLMLVGLYILMGMGLNLEVGLAGLLDLGFVAFFAVGAYTTALLTADSPHALASYTAIPTLSYWVAMPIAVFMSVVVGVIFGLPVLGVRGDYLAVATMGLGEIVRVIVQSDFAAPLLAGAQGILQIPKPVIGSFELSDPVDLFYLTLVASAVAAYCAWRLENSRLGRAWMALRDDEDVAQALGVNLVKVKLLAYGLGAAFAGLAGSIFAVMLTSVYPSSFQLLISINVLALVIVGGMGSLPGVIVGSAALVGLPELMREFGEYRYLFYGVALVVMMRIKPEGLWPSQTRRRELHADDEISEDELAVLERTGGGAVAMAPPSEVLKPDA